MAGESAELSKQAFVFNEYFKMAFFLLPPKLPPFFSRCTTGGVTLRFEPRGGGFSLNPCLRDVPPSIGILSWWRTHRRNSFHAGNGSPHRRSCPPCFSLGSRPAAPYQGFSPPAWPGCQPVREGCSQPLRICNSGSCVCISPAVISLPTATYPVPPHCKAGARPRIGQAQKKPPPK